MSSSVFDDASSYAPGVSVGMPVDADTFLANFANKKGRVRKKNIKAYREAGGDMQGLRDALEGKGGSDLVDPFSQREYKVDENVMQTVRNAAPSMDNVAVKDSGRISTRSFIDEFANARGRITKSDMKAFEKAGGNLAGLDKRLQKGGFTRDEVKAVEENLNRRGTAIRAGNEDYYTGGAGKAFLDNKLRRSRIPEDDQDFNPTSEEPSVPPDNDSDTPAEKIVEEITDKNPVGEGSTPDAGLDLGLKVDYGDLDPSSGFPFNPGRQTGEPFTDYQDRIPDIKASTQERIDALGIERVSAEDTLTHSYTQQLIDGGILPGSPGYVSAAEKDAARLEGDLAIKDAFSDEVAEQRLQQQKNRLEMLRENATARRQQKSEELWGEGGKYAAMRELQNQNMLRPEDYLPPITQMLTPDPNDVIGTPPEDKKDKDKIYGGMDDLPNKPGKQPLETPGLYKNVTTKTDGKKPPDDFKKKPAFDGSKDFNEFLRRAQMGGDATKLYNALRDAGLSEKEMYKGAQYAGITNLRTDNKSIRNDIKAIKHAVDNDYYEGWDGKGKSTTEKVLKDQKDLMNWYKSQGGELPLKVLERKAGYKNYDSENDAQRLVDIMQNQLSRAGIKGEVDPKQMVKFNKEMDELSKKFGGKYKWKNYQEALKDNSPADVNEWLTNYMNLGGGVNKRVIDAMKDQG